MDGDASTSLVGLPQTSRAFLGIEMKEGALAMTKGSGVGGQVVGGQWP